MNIEAYIASGILEEYVMGTASAQERQEVACMAAIYPEIKTELDAIEKAMEQYAMAHGVEPQRNKEKLVAAVLAAPREKKAPTKVVPLQKKTSGSAVGWKVYAAAASIVLAVSLYGYFNLRNTVADQKDAIVQAEQERTDAQNALSDIQRQLEQAQQALVGTVRPQDMLMVPLAPVGNNPKSTKATIAYNEKTHNVYLDAAYLPKVAADKQYQLWAIVNDKPVDLGVFNLNDQRQLIALQTNVENPAAFAITVEKHGGVPSPTMDAMVVMGEL